MSSPARRSEAPLLPRPNRCAAVPPRYLSLAAQTRTSGTRWTLASSHPFRPALLKSRVMVLPFVRDLFTDVEKLPAFTRVASHLKEGTGRVRVSGLVPPAKALLLVLLQ